MGCWAVFILGLQFDLAEWWREGIGAVWWGFSYIYCIVVKWVRILYFMQMSWFGLGGGSVCVWRRFLALVLLGVPFGLVAQPNVVLVLIDDLSHYGVTAYGSNVIGSVEGAFEPVLVDTPHINRVGAMGVRCDYAYVYPICEPTRIALMSGKTNMRNFLKPKAQHESDVTFGDLFKRAGYATCMVGKWKQSRGTDEIPAEAYIYEFGWDEFRCFDVTGEGRRMIEPTVVENGVLKTYRGIDPVTGRRYYGPDLFNRYALDFISRHKDQPFFLYYPMVLVHDEHTPTLDTRPKALFDEFDVETRVGKRRMRGDERAYFPDMLAYTDKMVGRLLDHLEQLGLADDTLVMVMGDNGTKECFYHQLPDGSVVRGDKGSNKEGGLHVPLLVSYTGRVPAGRVYEGLVHVTDVLPTLCEAAGIELVDPASIDGISFWDQLTGRSSAEHREVIYAWYNANSPVTDQSAKLEYAFTKSFKRYAPSTLYPQGRFFDLRTDRFEEAGPKKKYPRLWNKWHHAGLDVSRLTGEQREAFDRLGGVLEAERFVPVVSLNLGRQAADLKVGEDRMMQVSVEPSGASRRGVIWRSSDPSVMRVDKFGCVRGMAPGRASLSVYSWEDAQPLADSVSGPFSRAGIQDQMEIRVVAP